VEYDDRLTIATPEGVEVSLTLAGAASRFVAATIDLLIETALLIALGIVFGVAGPGFSGGVPVAVYALLSFVLIIGYDIFFEVRHSGRTPGKAMNGLRVVRTEGQPVGFVTSLIRNVLRIIDYLPLFYLLGATLILATRRNQRLGDVAAGTLVVRERRADLPALPAIPAAAAANPLSGSDTSWDTSRITPEELVAVRQFIERRNEIDYSARVQLGDRLAARLRPKVTGVPPDVHGELFLERLVAAKLRTP
jgi:uncharacterized RDD family membrane protein YckC